jgi:hypothetical protein
MLAVMWYLFDSLCATNFRGQISYSDAVARRTIVLKQSLNALWLVGALAAPLGHGTANASPISRTFDFTASDFFDIIGSNAAPVNTVAGSITVTFDPSVPKTDDATGIVLNSLNIALGSPISFDYFNMSDQIIFGGLQFGAATEGTGFDDFSVVFNSATADTPGFKSLLYRVSGPLAGSAFEYGTGSVTATPPVPVVIPPPTDLPEPGSLAVLTVGLGALAMMRRERTGAHRAPS